MAISCLQSRRPSLRYESTLRLANAILWSMYAAATNTNGPLRLLAPAPTPTLSPASPLPK